MRRIKEEKLEISYYPSSIAIDSFRHDLLRFVSITNFGKAYEKVREFINLEGELGLDKSRKTPMEVA